VRNPLALLRSLPDRRLLDRLIRGRAWIPVVGVLLAGIVAMRVEVLKLGVSVGNSVALASQLQSENQTLRADVASLSNAARIEHLAGTMGMVMPGPLDLHFIAASDDLGSAAAGITRPDPTTFESGLATQTAANSASINAVAPSSAATSGAPPAATSGAPSSSVSSPTTAGSTTAGTTAGATNAGTTAAGTTAAATSATSVAPPG